MLTGPFISAKDKPGHHKERCPAWSCHIYIYIYIYISSGSISKRKYLLSKEDKKPHP
jgi:hypothetical protein